MRSFIVCTAALVLASTAQAQKKNPLDGAWREIKFHVVSPDSAYEMPVAAGMVVVSGKYFSQTWVRQAPGVQQASAEASRPLTTPEEKAARFDRLTSNAGTVDVTDSTLTFHLQTARMPSAEGTTTTRTYKLRHDTLWTTLVRPYSKDSSKTVTTHATYVRMK